MTVPSIPTRCPHCSTRGPLRHARLVTCITDRRHDLTWWRGTCRNRRCARIVAIALKPQSARLYADAFPEVHVVIPPPCERRPDLGPWTDFDITQAEILAVVHDDLIWDELDADLNGTDSGVIDWGDQ